VARNFALALAELESSDWRVLRAEEY